LFREEKKKREGGQLVIVLHLPRGKWTVLLSKRG